MLKAQDRAVISLQQIIAGLAFPFQYILTVTWMRVVQRYGFEDLRAVRAEFRRIRRLYPGPLLICPNHLTMIDSLILLWIMAPLKSFLFDPNLFAWNVPEKRNFAHNFWMKLFCFFGKCIPIVRQGQKEQTALVMDKLVHLLNQDQCVMIFPEGTRSRTGRIDTENFTYGVGQIIQRSHQARALCVYLRGVGQEQHSFFPRVGERFKVEMQILKWNEIPQGLRGARDLSRDIIHKLIEMENRFFESSHAAISGQ